MAAIKTKELTQLASVMGDVEFSQFIRGALSVLNNMDIEVESFSNYFKLGVEFAKNKNKIAEESKKEKMIKKEVVEEVEAVEAVEEVKEVEKLEVVKEVKVETTVKPLFEAKVSKEIPLPFDPVPVKKENDFDLVRSLAEEFDAIPYKATEEPVKEKKHISMTEKSVAPKTNKNPSMGLSSVVPENPITKFNCKSSRSDISSAKIEYLNKLSCSQKPSLLDFVDFAYCVCPGWNMAEALYKKWDKHNWCLQMNPEGSKFFAIVNWKGMIMKTVESDNNPEHFKK